MNIGDRRRIIGPVNARALYFENSKPKESIHHTRKKNNEIRPFFIQTGLLTNPNGSAYLEIDNTLILVSIFGPRPIKGPFMNKACFQVETKFLPYVNQPNYLSKAYLFNTNNNATEEDVNIRRNLDITGGSYSSYSNIEQKISSYIHSAFLPSIILEKYPKSTIDVFIIVLSANVEDNVLSLISGISNCCSLALVDSGIELNDIISTGISRILKDNTVILDPTTIHNKDITDDGKYVDAVISFMNCKNDQIVGFLTDGNLNIDNSLIEALINNSNRMAKQIRANIDVYLIDQISSN
ncbi:exosome non-catalytic core subunit MTR3 [Ascoidea rubescens DSM 1968]|uniref:Exosome exoribonuclease n=1 Tax=Ascoidea rubescens DSM 1968 TaxID=1344418 RepID=A0A1D2VGV8_9ASCO|nr:exosome exoribonuclease [Ascoidea rubescens DSM 1968]ODV60723.1 exosome exoribonuclease [Ascoidea rubescens DSM 1968]